MQSVWKLQAVTAMSIFWIRRTPPATWYCRRTLSVGVIFRDICASSTFHTVCRIMKSFLPLDSKGPFRCRSYRHKWGVIPGMQSGGSPLAAVADVGMSPEKEGIPPTNSISVSYAIPVYPNRGNEARGRPNIPSFPRIPRRALDAWENQVAFRLRTRRAQWACAAPLRVSHRPCQGSLVPRVVHNAG